MHSHRDIYRSYREQVFNALEKSPRFCRVDLVAFMIDGDLGTLDADADYCRNESQVHPDGICWCGKFRRGEIEEA